MEDTALQLKQILRRAVEKRPADGILLSGGLDSSVVAALAPAARAVTVTLENYGQDTGYARQVARFLGMERFHLNVKVEDAVAAIPRVVKILASFDPALPNDLAVYFGLKKAKELGLRRVLTGDASDELLGGYSFMAGMADLSGYIRKIAARMNFSSNKIGEFFGIEIVQPFLDKSFVDYALELNPKLKIKNEAGKTWGKWVLRKAFEDILPREIAWQSKRPLEYGSGMNKLRQIIEEKVSPQELTYNPDKISFINKEHRYYYKIYKDIFGAVPPPREGQVLCLGCGTGLPRGAFHCETCGWVDS